MTPCSLYSVQCSDVPEDTSHAFFLWDMQPEDFVKEVEKDDFQSVFDRAAAAHPDCTLGLMVDKLETWLTQEERKNYRGNIRCQNSNAGGFR